MFTLLEGEEKKIQNFISAKLLNNENEVEARFFPLNYNNTECIEYYNYNNILRKYIFSKDKNGFGLKYDKRTQLNITSEQDINVRESIRGDEVIKLFWLTNDVEKIKEEHPDNIFKMTKTKKDHLHIKNYPVKIALADEKVDKSKTFKLLSDTKFPKEYRLQNRISVYTDDGLFRIDFTSVKFSKGKTFRSSNVINAFPCYEIEIEILDVNKENKDVVFKNFLKHIYTLFTIYYNTPLILTKTEKTDIVDKYKMLISKDEAFKKSNRSNNKNYNNFITAKPVTLHLENIKKNSGVENILTNYGVTYKADGKCMLLFVSPEVKDSNVFLIDSNFNVLSVGFYLEEWDNTLIEGEYIEEKHLFCCYDILFSKNLDVRNKQLETFNKEQTSRLHYLKEFVSSVSNIKKTINIIEKKYLFGNEEKIFENAKELLDQKNLQPFHIDGLIFAPATLPYPTKIGSWSALFKWKPPNLNSIDFLIKTVKNKNGRDELFSYIGETKDQLPNTVRQYKKIELYCSSSRENLNRRTGNLNRKLVPKLFKEIKLLTNTKGQIFSRDPLSNIVNEVKDNTIVEFSYNVDNKDFPWTPIRVRHDKTIKYRQYENNFGNHINVVEDVWKSIINPVTEEIITTGIIPVNDVKYTSNVKTARLPYQNFHTVYIKNELLKMVSLSPVDEDRGAGYLIDFGVCRGGDLNRWDNIGFTKVVGIDIDPECIEEATKRYTKSNNKVDVTFLCGDLSKLIFPKQDAACPPTIKLSGRIDWKKLMRETLVQKYIFDVVSSQFVIHYFFRDELSIRSYLQNVSDNLKIGGYFVGSTFDGSKVYNFLKKKKEVNGNNSNKEVIWNIKKLYDRKVFNVARPNYGMEIEVFIKSIGIPHKEYLVNFKFLEKIAKEYGLELEKIIPFSDLWKEGKDSKEYNSKITTDIQTMSNDEKKFSFLFSGFVFKKIKHAPDSTYKKILKLIKKSEKN